MKPRVVHAWVCLPLIVLAVGCSAKVELPEAVRGTWRLEDGDGVRLRIEQQGDRGAVFLGTGPEETEALWFGPLPLRGAGNGVWKFHLPSEIVSVEGNTTTRIGRPRASRLGELLVDQHGRRLVRSSEHLVEDERAIVLRFDGERLTAVGLWVRVENQEWNDRGEPTRQTVAPLVSVLTRLGIPQGAAATFRRSW